METFHDIIDGTTCYTNGNNNSLITSPTLGSVRLNRLVVMASIQQEGAKDITYTNSRTKVANPASSECLRTYRQGITYDIFQQTCCTVR